MTTMTVERLDVTKPGTPQPGDDEVRLRALSGRSPLVVSYGAGVDSTAMLVGLHARGERPDLILFADTGSEKPETYAYLPTLRAWLARVGFPALVVVRNPCPRTGDTSLADNVERNETLPSLAFGRKGCSLRWKVEPMDTFVGRWSPARAAWAGSVAVVRAIGYDAGPADSKRAWKLTDSDDGRYRYRYPLREWGWDRERCKREIVAAGLPLPIKSACWFCPASKRAEVEWLRAKHPDLYARAVAIEEGAAKGRHGLKTTKGLGRNWAWGELAGLPLAEATDAPPECGTTCGGF